jgi:hypothetical protein
MAILSPQKRKMLVNYQGPSIFLREYARKIAMETLDRQGNGLGDFDPTVNQETAVARFEHFDILEQDGGPVWRIEMPLESRLQCPQARDRRVKCGADVGNFFVIKFHGRLYVFGIEGPLSFLQ